MQWSDGRLDRVDTPKPANNPSQGTRAEVSKCLLRFTLIRVAAYDITDMEAPS